MDKLQEDTSLDIPSQSVFSKIKFVKEDIINLINGQGCLVRKDDAIVFNRLGKVGNLEWSYGVTSHGFITCAEVVGKFDNGDRFYIHALDPNDFRFILTQMIREEKFLGENEIAVEELHIKCDFAWTVDHAQAATQEQYEDACRRMFIPRELVEITDVAITGNESPKLVRRGRVRVSNFS